MKVLLMYAPGDAHRAALEDAAPGVDLRVAENQAEAQTLITEADAVLGNRWFLQSLPHARRLRWMQSNSMGLDLILTAGDRLAGVTLTSARGVYDDEVADHALALLLALARGVPQARDAQRRCAWERRVLAPLAGQRALLLGWGGIARALAVRLLACRMEVHAVRRRADPGPQPAGQVTIWGAAWREALAESRWVVAALPLTPLTRHFLGDEEIRRLPAGAAVVNVGRGGTVDDAALLAGLREGRLSGVGLDVFETEPLPPENPLWGEPDALVTPHVGRAELAPPYRWEPLFVENLRRFAAGEPLLNVVDPDAGY